MEGRPASAWFVGDLGDPWVLSIAEALPREVRWISCPEDLPSDWLSGEVVPPETLVLHRSILQATDCQRLARLVSRIETPVHVVLCPGPFVRYADLTRWSRLFDEVVPEATAAETIGRHLRSTLRRSAPALNFEITVASTDFEWREMMTALCRAAGYSAHASDDRIEMVSSPLMVWDVPILRADWPETLRSRTKRGQVVGVFGFPDRDTIAEARRAGIAACLDAPCELDDLRWVLDRAAARRPTLRSDTPHAFPPSPTINSGRTRPLGERPRR